MYLKKLELHGFKSFAPSTTLEFQRGISAVVGPNGSGKSNVADALRFVLGEQSMKSIRSKKGEDLIFSGSPSKSRMSVASVTLYFDNTDGAFPLAFETVIIKRKIFRDGENQYFINDAQVRLKDLAELIAKAKLGLKGYTIINQGMGDAILDASAKDRKEIIFEALGLREFQLKRQESLLKLSHTQVNLEKAEGIAKELEPHVKFLRRQAEKIEERHKVERRLKSTELAYALRRARACEEKLGQLSFGVAEREKRVAGLRRAVDAAGREIEAGDTETAQAFSGVSQLEHALSKEESARNGIEREIGKIEGMFSMMKENVAPAAHIDISYVKIKMEELNQRLADVIREGTYEAIRQKLDHFARAFGELLESITAGKAQQSGAASEKNGHAKIEREHTRLADLLRTSDERIKEIKEEIKKIHTQHAEGLKRIFEMKNEKKENEMELRRAEEDYAALRGETEHVRAELGMLNKEKSVLESGKAVSIIEDDLPLEGSDEDVRKNIERLKIRLESIDLIDDGVTREYEETKTRFEFLSRESQDLRQAIVSLHKVIKELDGMISVRFRDAFKKINENFNTYFKMLFEGGSARLEISEGWRAQDHEEGSAPEEGEGDADEGVEMEVALPRKKMTGLSILSGGERALTSLALLFALVSTSPPPFLVLDEIDAPLDEANSVRFAKILSELKGHTQFVVITHNRETMRQSNILWGVTMQEDGISKILSLKLEAAQETAR